MRLSLLGRNVEKLDKTASQCRARGADVMVHGGDVGDADSMVAWLTASDESLPVDLIIANAGIGGDLVLAGTGGENLATANRIVTTNVQGVMNSVVPLLPHMIARRRGAIVIISSLAAFIALPIYRLPVPPAWMI